jgi:class 3 adenylate cyclase
MRICVACGERNPDRARFCMQCAEPLDRVVYRRQERKVVSMVFADLEGSTAMEERLDQETVRALLTRFYVLSREILERHGGTVEKFIGDAVMGVFGVPRTHEDDALRASRSAVELRDTIARTNEELIDRYGVALRLRIGVNTGEVVAGDPRETSFVSGDAVNVAARLEQNAEAGAILIGEDTFLAAQAYLQAEPVEPLPLKGKSERVPAYHLIAVSDYWQSRPIGSPLVGRESEMAALQRAFRQVTVTKDPAMMLVLGEPGIGKSRLVHDFLQSAEETARVGAARCLDDEDLPWRRVFAELLRQLAGLRSDDDIDEVTNSVTKAMGPTERSPLVVAEALGMVGLGQPGTLKGCSWALRELVAALSERSPLILSIDDLHLGGPELLEFLGDLLAGERGPVLVLATAQPEFAAEVSESRPRIAQHVEDLELASLGPSSVSLMAEHLLSAPLNESAKKVILDACGGNPLFLAETIRMFRDRGVLPRDPVDLDLAGGQQNIPRSIRSLIAARLDVLGDVDREVLCVAAVIGLQLEIEELLAIGPPEILDHLDSRLERLVDRQLLHEAPQGRLQFPHAIIRQVAYDTMTKEARTGLHVACAGRRELNGDLAGAGWHLERAYELQRELSSHDGRLRELVARGAIDLAAAGLAAIERLDVRAAVTFEQRASKLRSAFDDVIPMPLAQLAFRLGAWGDVARLLDRGSDDELAADAAHWLGVAILKRGVGEDGGDADRGRRLLRQAADAGDTDALVALAGTWRGVADDRARELYLSVIEIDPSEPYALGNLLEYEIERSSSASVVARYRSSIHDAIERRRAETVVGRDVPWSWFDLGKFQLLLGAANEAYRSFAAGALTSAAAYMQESALASIRRLAERMPEQQGLAELTTLLRLAAVASFGADRASVADLATPGALPLSPPVLILAGASDETSPIIVSRLRAPLLAALTGAPLTLVSGGTTSGVSGLVGDLTAVLPSARAIGYLPSTIPSGLQQDVRYGELRTTDNWTFSTKEPLRYWADILTAGLGPDDVRLLAVGGGELSGLEYRTALAFGARVAVLRDSGGEASAILRDTAWAISDRLVEISPTEEEVRAFATQAG